MVEPEKALGGVLGLPYLQCPYSPRSTWVITGKLLLCDFMDI